VVAVGGTSLVLADDNSIAYETGWRLSGGGKGSPLLRPVWQVAASLAKGKYRYVPDVSFIGDERTGVQVYWRGHEIQAGGTSLGAPAWAAIWALVLQNAQNSGKTVASAPQTIYRVANSAAYAQTFHDITEGSNGRYDAGLGWDAVTGWGTPDVAQLAAAVLAGTAT
jgi:kumamolisin